MDKTAKIRMKAKRNVTDLAGEKVMVDFEQGKYFCIKGVGNDIWDMLDGQEGEDGITVEAILHKLMEEYEVMEEVCEKEVLAFLEKLEQAGIRVPYSCGAGIWGCCRIKLVEGEVTALKKSAVCDDGTILCCSCVPKTSVQLEA